MSRGGPPADLPIRFGLGVVSFGLLWLMDRALLGYATEFQATLSFPVGTWLGVVALGALAGVGFGIAARYGRWGGPYRWGAALLLAAPPLLVLLLHYAFLAGVVQGLPPVASTFLGDRWLAISAVLLGVAGTAGISPRRTP